MGSNGKLVTIPEAAKVTGKTVNTIYRYIRSGKIKCKKTINNGREVCRVSIHDLQALSTGMIYPNISDISENISFDISNDTSDKINSHNDNSTPNISPDISGNISDISKNISMNISDISGIKELLKAVVKETISEEQSQLMKPIQEQAVYRVGRLEEMVKHLEGEKEALRQEVDLYKSQLMALPGPVEEITDKLNKLAEQEQQLKNEENTIVGIQTELNDIRIKKESLEAKLLQEVEEKQQLQSKLEILPHPPEKVSQILLDNAENMKIILKDNDKLQKEREALQKQKEEFEKRTYELVAKLENSKTEKEELEARLKAQAEKEKAEIAEAWKKELEMAKKPWWKLW